MIELRNITKSYPVNNKRHIIFRDISLVLPDRKSIAVIGPNGAGKSTFLRLISGAEMADSGTIICPSEVSWPLGLTSGFKGTSTGRENVTFVCDINGLSRKEASEVIRQIIDFAEIGEYFDMPINSYSSGMRARLSFGLCIAFEFDFYLVDELTSVGDTIFREKAKAAFQSIRKRASLIYASHNMKALSESCESAVFLRDEMADFYENIEDGIEAYTEYIRERRNHGDVKTRKKKRGDQQLRKLMKKRKGKQNQANVRPEDPEIPIL